MKIRVEYSVNLDAEETRVLAWYARYTGHGYDNADDRAAIRRLYVSLGESAYLAAFENHQFAHSEES